VVAKQSVASKNAPIFPQALVVAQPCPGKVIPKRTRRTVFEDVIERIAAERRGRNLGPLHASLLNRLKAAVTEIPQSIQLSDGPRKIELFGFDRDVARAILKSVQPVQNQMIGALDIHL